MLKYGNSIFRKIGTELSREDGCACVKNEKGTILLNISATIVWGYIDSYLDAESISNNMKEVYKEANTPEYIDSIVDDSLDILLENELIERVVGSSDGTK